MSDESGVVALQRKDKKERLDLWPFPILSCLSRLSHSRQPIDDEMTKPAPRRPHDNALRGRFARGAVCGGVRDVKAID